MSVLKSFLKPSKGPTSANMDGMLRYKTITLDALVIMGHLSEEQAQGAHYSAMFRDLPEGSRLQIPVLSSP